MDEKGDLGLKATKKLQQFDAKWSGSCSVVETPEQRHQTRLRLYAFCSAFVMVNEVAFHRQLTVEIAGNTLREMMQLDKKLPLLLQSTLDANELHTAVRGALQLKYGLQTADNVPAEVVRLICVSINAWARSLGVDDRVWLPTFASLLRKNKRPKKKKRKRNLEELLVLLPEAAQASEIVHVQGGAKNGTLDRWLLANAKK